MLRASHAPLRRRQEKRLSPSLGIEKGTFSQFCPLSVLLYNVSIAGKMSGRDMWDIAPSPSLSARRAAVGPIT